jgi:hypothetical protein
MKYQLEVKHEQKNKHRPLNAYQRYTGKGVAKIPASTKNGDYADMGHMGFGVGKSHCSERKTGRIQQRSLAGNSIKFGMDTATQISGKRDSCEPECKTQYPLNYKAAV